uniref:F-box domain-containing protein n=1 Tax=Oryza rufipogon TaxID=4529 RepID=A0A0E0Q5T6_ORYRU
MDAKVDEVSKAYQELVAAAQAILEARRQPGGENTAAMDAAREAFEQRRKLFAVACDDADALVQSARQSIVSDPGRFVDVVTTPDEDSVRSPTRSSAESSSSSGFGALPDEVLRHILLRLPSAAAAARTSLISRRWRNLWSTLLPKLRFPGVTDLARVGAALRLRVAPVRLLRIESSDRAPDKIVAVLHLAAPLLEGKLCFDVITPAAAAAGAAGTGGAIQIPCFEKATEITIRLRGRLGIQLPPSGVFAKLTALSLSHCRFDDQGQRDLGDAVSSEGCPSLRELRIRDADVVSNLAIRSESLRLVQLSRLEGIRQLTISAPALTELDLYACLLWGMPMVDIFAPALETLHWIMDMSCELLVQAVKKLPAVEILSLRLLTIGHTFGPCVYHLLKMSTGIRELKLKLEDHIADGEVPCSSGCVCYEPQAWKKNNISLNFLQKVEINNLSGAERQIYFVKRLLRWTMPELKTITLSFDPLVTVSEKVSRKLLSFSTPGICMEIYLHRNGTRVKYSAAN